MLNLLRICPKVLSFYQFLSLKDLSASKKTVSKYGSASPGGLLGNDTESLSSEISTSERERFDDVTETILLELEAVCMDEQSFSIHFFKMETRFLLFVLIFRPKNSKYVKWPKNINNDFLL